MALLVDTHPLAPQPYADALRALAPQMRVWTSPDEAVAEDVEAVIAWRLRPGAAARWPRLRLICSLGAGVDKIVTPDLPPAVTVTRTVDPQQSQAIAQYVLAYVLRQLRDIPLYEAQQAEARWQRHAQRPLSRCRVGVLGQGEVGMAVARAGVALGLPVAVWGRTRRRHEGIESFAGEAELPALLASSDFLVCALPLTPATRRLLDRQRLSALPPGAHLVSVGRGEQVVEDDLKALLDDGHLGGAALDVFEREPPPPDHWVWRHPKVFASPHIAGEARVEQVARQCLQALQALREGRMPAQVVDRASGY